MWFNCKWFSSDMIKSSVIGNLLWRVKSRINRKIILPMKIWLVMRLKNFIEKWNFLTFLPYYVER